MGPIIAVTITAFLAGAALMVLANAGVAAEARRQRWTKLVSYFVVVHLVLVCAWLGRQWLVALIMAIVAVGSWELDRAIRHGKRRYPGLGWRVWPPYAILSAALLFAVGHLPASAAAFLYLVVAAFDGFSQVVGQLLGRRRLAPAISPSKTIEGLFGGILGALAVSWATHDLAGIAAPIALIIGALTALCALVGDLAASWIKRRAGIKDFSRLIPAHGGVLDRFDSFITAAAIVGPALYAVSRPSS